MGVPPEMAVYFQSVTDAAASMPGYQADPRPGMVLVGEIATMLRLVSESRAITRVNIGGVHHAAGRVPRLRYVFLTPDEEACLRDIARLGVDVTAQDVPASRAVPLDELLATASDA